MNLKHMKVVHGGERMGLKVTYIICTSSLIVCFIAYSLWIIRSLQRTIKDQNETIQKLLNREPVTYKEVNTQPPKLDTDRPIAWGGTIAGRDEL